MTAPISRNASNSRISIDISLGAVPWLSLFGVWAILTSVCHFRITAPDQSRPHARGDSATAGTDLSTSLARPRTAPRIAAYTPSRSDRSGTPQGETGKLRIDRFEA